MSNVFAQLAMLHAVKPINIVLHLEEATNLTWQLPCFTATFFILLITVVIFTWTVKFDFELMLEHDIRGIHT